MTQNGAEKPKNHGKPWTVEDMWELCELWEKPITVRSVALAVGRSETACHARIYIIRLAFELHKDMKIKDAEKIMKSLDNAPGRKIPRRESK